MNGLRRSVVVAALLFGATVGHAAGSFDLRIVKIGAPPGDPRAHEHLEHSRRLGFNAVWVYATAVGAWTPEAAPDGPRLDPAFVELARRCRRRGLRVVVSVNPWAETGGRFVFHEPESAERIVALFRLLRERAHVSNFVVSFDDQPRQLTELSDLLVYGRSSAPAHLDLVRRIAAGLHRRDRLWFCAAAYADRDLGDGTGPYARAFLEGLPSLPEGVGIVWTGPTPVPATIRREDLVETRRRLGGRRLLLYDNYPANGDWYAEAAALVLGPLRGRDSELAAEAEAYLACPMTQLGASRLPLATVADWLRDPADYEPDASWSRALASLAGDDEGVRRVLRRQATEWGGWIGEPGYLPVFVENVYTLAEAIEDDALAASMARVEERYPDRIERLAGIRDEAFRRDLLDMMERRLALARAIRWIRAYRAASGRDEAEAGSARKRLAELLDRQPEGTRRTALATFYEAAGVATDR